MLWATIHYPPPSDSFMNESSISSTFVGKNIFITYIKHCCGSGLISDPGLEFFHRGSGSAQNLYTIFDFTQEIKTKPSEIWSGMFIPDLRSGFFPSRIQGVKKAPDPGSATPMFSTYLGMDAEVLSGAECETHHAHILLHLSLKKRGGTNIRVHRFESLLGTTRSCLWTEPQPVLWIGRCREDFLFSYQ